MTSPPAFLQRTRCPASLTAILAMAGLMTLVFFVVPGVVLLTRQASDGTVPCQVRSTGPAALAPGAETAPFREIALSLVFEDREGVRARSVECKFGPDNHAPLRIAYRPSALGIEASGPGGTLACSVRPPGETSEPVTLRFENGAGGRFDAALVCPGGARPNRPMRIDYDPHDVGLRSFTDAPGPFNTKGDNGPEPVAAAICFAIATPFLALVGWAFWRLRRVYVIAPLATSPGGTRTTVPSSSVPEPAHGTGPATIVDPTGPGSVFYAVLPGVFLAFVGALIAAWTATVNVVGGVGGGGRRRRRRRDDPADPPTPDRRPRERHGRHRE